MQIRIPSLTIVLLAFLAFGCSEKQNLVEPSTLTVEASTDTVHIYPFTVKYVNLTVHSSDNSTGDPVNETRDFGEFRITGPWVDNTADQSTYLAVGGTTVTNAPRTVTISMTFGDRSVTLPLTISVDDFSLLKKFVTNAPNDTIVVQRGANFLLQFTCLDSTDQPLSKERIFQEIGGFGWGIVPSYSIRLAVEYINRDPLVWEYLISSIPDTEPAPEDNAFSFQFQISNKILSVPIRIVD